MWHNVASASHGRHVIFVTVVTVSDYRSRAGSISGQPTVIRLLQLVVWQHAAYSKTQRTKTSKCQFQPQRLTFSSVLLERLPNTSLFDRLAAGENTPFSLGQVYFSILMFSVQLRLFRQVAHRPGPQNCIMLPKYKRGDTAPALLWNKTDGKLLQHVDSYSRPSSSLKTQRTDAGLEHKITLSMITLAYIL